MNFEWWEGWNPTEGIKEIMEHDYENEHKERAWIVPDGEYICPHHVVDTGDRHRSTFVD